MPTNETAGVNIEVNTSAPNSERTKRQLEAVAKVTDRLTRLKDELKRNIDAESAALSTQSKAQRANQRLINQGLRGSKEQVRTSKALTEASDNLGKAQSRRLRLKREIAQANKDLTAANRALVKTKREETKVEKTLTSEVQKNVVATKRQTTSAKQNRNAQKALTADLKRTASSQKVLAREARRAARAKDDQGRSARKLSDVLVVMGKRVAAVALIYQGFRAAIRGVRFALRTAREFEDITAQLITATGSAQGAGIALRGVQEVAQQLPFSLTETLEGFVKLVNFGLDPSEEALISYANTASATGKRLRQFIEAVADAITFEFERLKEFGILARQTDDTVAFTFRGVRTEVERTAAGVEGFLKSLGTDIFAGAAAERVNTLGGAFTNLVDAIKTATDLFSQASGFGDLVKEQALRGITGVESLSEYFRGLIKLQEQSRKESEQAAENERTRNAVGEINPPSGLPLSEEVNREAITEGTGQAGRIIVAVGRQLATDIPSMIGTAIDAFGVGADKLDQTIREGVPALGRSIVEDLNQINEDARRSANIRNQAAIAETRLNQALREEEQLTDAINYLQQDTVNYRNLQQTIDTVEENARNLIPFFHTAQGFLNIGSSGANDFVGLEPAGQDDFEERLQNSFAFIRNRFARRISRGTLAENETAKVLRRVRAQEARTGGPYESPIERTIRQGQPQGRPSSPLARELQRGSSQTRPLNGETNVQRAIREATQQRRLEETRRILRQPRPAPIRDPIGRQVVEATRTRPPTPQEQARRLRETILREERTYRPPLTRELQRGSTRRRYPTTPSREPTEAERRRRQATGRGRLTGIPAFALGIGGLTTLRANELASPYETLALQQINEFSGRRTDVQGRIPTLQNAYNETIRRQRIDEERNIETPAFPATRALFRSESTQSQPTGDTEVSIFTRAIQSVAGYIQRIQDIAEGGTTEGIVDFVSQGLPSTGTGQFRAPQGRAFENIFEEPEQVRRLVFGDRIQDTTPQIDATSGLSSIREIAPLLDRIELFESGNQDQLFFDTFAEDMERATGVLGQFQVQVDKTTPVVEDFGRTLRDPEVVDAVNKIDFAFQQAFRTAREGVAALSSAEQGGGSILANLFGRGRIDEAEDNLAVIQQRYADEREAVISNTKKTEEEKLALIRQLRAKETSELEAIGIKDARNRLEVEDQFYTDLLTLAQTGNKEFVALYKASAISQTIIATYSSAQKAFDALAGIPIVGPGLATGAAAIAVAAGLARVAIIKAQRFQEGGIVGGGSRFGDNTIVRANAGEMFINTQQQRELFNFIRGGSRGRRSVNNVNIYGAPAGTRTETSQNAQGGEDTDVFIGNAVRGIIAQDLATGTGVSPMLESVYGMRRIG